MNIISLGAGGQSSTMALMAAHGEITPTPNAAIFADVGDEPVAVYKWLKWLTETIENPLRVDHPFPVYVVTAGNLSDEFTKVRVAKNGLQRMGTVICAH